ncbi:hypothetical protein HID58_000471 [Brassica napus]|uniref:Homeobox domain-containing protein n=1 Tax=Brassica napus TaxID=3708 RepID=A0ABQ8EGL9_BRANA|nr:hypothetical protein HID58_000471 [Brassica napus]
MLPKSLAKKVPAVEAPSAEDHHSGNNIHQTMSHYPKDSEKHLLAIRSVLTRSQVSNWFINARIRLWKPMIEDMYAEMNKSKMNMTHLQGGIGGSIIRVPKSVMMSQERDTTRE